MSHSVRNKRRQILVAAAEIFADRGFHQAKIADIAAAAGVGKGTVYEYFDSKKDLFQQLMLHLFTTYYFSYLKRAGEQEPPLETFIERVITESLRFFQDYRGIARIIFNNHPPLDANTQELLLKVRRDILNYLKSYFQAAARRGEMREVSSWLVATLVIGLTASLGHQMMIAEGKMDVAGTISEAKYIILKGIVKNS